jgi:hypothetical protein
MRHSRFKDAYERLAKFFDDRRHMPFEWGANDCALFFADAHLAMTGVDLAEGLRGYKTERQALQIIKENGGSLGALLESRGASPIRPSFAQRGDPVIVSMSGREAICVCGGNGYAYGPGEHGLAYRPMREAVTAYEV